MRALTQKELADLVGTKQPSIARLESGSDLPRLSFLRRVVEALGLPSPQATDLAKNPKHRLKGHRQ